MLTSRPYTRSRGGFSLTEVLVAAFVGLIGLLSLAALIPLGLLQISQSVRSDTAGYVARAAWREIRIHDLLNYAKGVRPAPESTSPNLVPSSYFRADGSPFSETAQFSFLNGRLEFLQAGDPSPLTFDVPVAPQSAFVIDPFGLAFTSSPEMNVFPCQQGGSDPAAGLNRVTIGALAAC